VGATLPGGHTVTELIDVGGMGRVYRAEQKNLGRSVAVKIIHPHMLGDRMVEARFVTEARAASKLNHPNSVTILDFGKHDGRFYIVMELLRGRDLASVVREEGALAPRRAVDIVCQALAALAEAHHHGIVHRDVKTENLFLEPLRTGGDFIKVLDFGLAQFRGALQSGSGGGRITSPGIVCGTPEYMSPEQARGAALDHRSDIYSMGVVLHELLVGRLPFRADSLQEIVRLHMMEAPPDPRALLPEELAEDPERRIPGPLVDALMRMLSKSPDERHQSAEELYAQLRSAVTTVERAAELACASCGAPVPRLQSFCGHCGATVARRKARTVAPPPRHLSEPPDLPLRGRDDELRWLYWLSSRATDALVAAVVEGPPGIGRTRLATEFLRERERIGDRVVTVGPDPWGAGVHWHALREAIVELADLRDAPIDSSSWFGASPEARAGLQLLLGRQHAVPTLPEFGPWEDSVPFLPMDSEKRVLVAEALRWAVGVSVGRAQGRVLLFIEDLPSLDGASRNAFADLVNEPPLASLLILGAAVPGFDSGWTSAEHRRLDGLPEDEASAIVETLGNHDASTLDSLASAVAVAGKIAPLYIDQLVRYAAEGGKAPPARLLELVGARLAGLAPETRRVLQAIAVLGDVATSTHLVALLPEVASFGEHLVRLRELHLIATRDGEHLVSHPLLRELVLQATPPAAREELHARALHDFGDESLTLPLEVRANHAYQAGDTRAAGPLLEEVARITGELGDREGRVTALSRALDMARRAFARGDAEDRVGPLLVLSGKLAEALLAAGRPAHAIGIVREALELAPPNAVERPRLLATLANATLEQGHFSAALGHLGEAVRVARHARREDLAESLERMLASWTA